MTTFTKTITLSDVEGLDDAIIMAEVTKTNYDLLKKVQKEVNESSVIGSTQLGNEAIEVKNVYALERGEEIENIEDLGVYESRLEDIVVSFDNNELYIQFPFKDVSGALCADINISIKELDDFFLPSDTEIICEGCKKVCQESDLSDVMEMYICNTCEDGMKEKYCNFCLMDVETDEEDNCLNCGNPISQEILEKDEEINNLSNENKNMAKALESLGFTQDEISNICHGSYMPTQKPILVSDESIKEFVATTIFSDAESRSDFDSYMEDANKADLQLWGPFEDYPVEWIKEYMETSFDELKTFLQYNEVKDIVSIDDVNLGVKSIDEEGATTVAALEIDFSNCPECASEDIEYDVNGIEPEGGVYLQDSSL